MDRRIKAILAEEVSNKCSYAAGVGSRSKRQEQERVVEASRLDFLCTASNQFVNLVGLNRGTRVGVIPSGLDGGGAGEVVVGILLFLASISCLVDAGEDSRHLEAARRRSWGTARAGGIRDEAALIATAQSRINVGEVEA